MNTHSSSRPTTGTTRPTESPVNTAARISSSMDSDAFISRFHQTVQQIIRGKRKYFIELTVLLLRLADLVSY